MPGDCALTQRGKNLPLAFAAIKSGISGNRSGGRGAGIHGVSTATGLIFATGLVKIPRRESRLKANHAVALAQSVRAPDCGSGGRRFESAMPPHFTASPRRGGVVFISLWSALLHRGRRSCKVASS